MKYKKGDQIICKKSKGGVPEDQILEVLTCSQTIVTVIDSEGRQWTVYLSGPNKDEVILADRPSRLKYATERVEELKKELAKSEREVIILRDYESDEAYTAFKLSSILKAKDDPKAIENLLKELKETHYL